MADHTLTLDDGGIAAEPCFQVFCSCGWNEGRWHHPDQYMGGGRDRLTAENDAMAAAIEAGQDHRADAE